MARYFPLAIGLALMAYGIFGSLRGCGGASPWVAKAAPDFSLPRAEGGSASLSALRGQVVVLDFYSLSCGPCMAEMPAMAELDRRYRDRGVAFLAVNTDIGDVRQRDSVLAIARREQWPMTLLLDDGRAADAYRIDMIPRVLVVGRDGRTRADFTGLQREGTLAEAIEQAL